MRIHTLKWQAITIQGHSQHGLTREEAAALYADLVAVEAALASDRSDHAVTAAEDRVDAISLQLTGRGRQH